MKKKKGSYKTNKAGYIPAGNSQKSGEPNSTVIKGDDVRSGKGSRGKGKR